MSQLFVKSSDFSGKDQRRAPRELSNSSLKLLCVELVVSPSLRTAIGDL
jgi:hypothetical protein